MAGHHKEHQVLVQHGVLHHAQDVEPGEDGLGEVDVLVEAGVVAAADEVRRGHDGTAGLQAGHDTRLIDTDALLLQILLDTGPGLVIHFVELVDQTDALNLIIFKILTKEK